MDWEDYLRVDKRARDLMSEGRSVRKVRADLLRHFSVDKNEHSSTKLNQVCLQYVKEGHVERMAGIFEHQTAMKKQEEMAAERKRKRNEFYQGLREEKKILDARMNERKAQDKLCWEAAYRGGEEALRYILTQGGHNVNIFLTQWNRTERLRQMHGEEEGDEEEEQDEIEEYGEGEKDREKDACEGKEEKDEEYEEEEGVEEEQEVEVKEEEDANKERANVRADDPRLWPETRTTSCRVRSSHVGSSLRKMKRVNYNENELAGRV